VSTGPTVRDVCQAIEAWAPPALAAEWDRVGLQVGSLEAPASPVLLAVDLSDRVVDEALALGAHMIVCHHPVIFRPLEALTDVDPTGARILRLVRAGIAAYSAHTNLDAAPEGSTSDALAEAIGCFDEIHELHSGSQEPMCKLVTFVPSEHVDEVFQAMAGCGAGQIGDYSHCSFRLAGTGTFLPGATTQPHIGQPGKLEQVDEVRLETLVPPGKLATVVRAMVDAHPYEEPAHDIYPLRVEQTVARFARMCVTGSPMKLSELAERARERLSQPAVWFAGDTDARVERVVVCAGGGGSIVDEAARAGADALVTGEAGHHDVLRALDLGVSVVGMGHHTSERPVLDVLRRRLCEVFGETVDIRIARDDEDPIRGCCA